MANQIVLKKSSVAAKIPLAADLVYGELALNYADGKLYYKKSDNTIDAFSSVPSNVLSLSGGTMTGVITTPNGTHGIIIGDDSRLADRNVANTLFVEGNQNNDRGYINFGNTYGNSLGAIAGGPLTWNGNTVWHAGNDGNGSGLDADLLDGQDSAYYRNWSNLTSIPANLITEYASTGSLAVGWYTIAVNPGNRASAKFILADTTSGLHQTVHFYASHHYGIGNNITVLHNDWYGGGGPIRYIRIKEGGTYDGCMLQIYIDSPTTGLYVYMLEDVQSSGFAIKSFVADDTDPGGTGTFANLTNEAVKVDLDLSGTVISHELYIGGATTQYKALHTSNYSSYALPLTGGIMTGDTQFNTSGIGITWGMNTDSASIKFYNAGDSDTDSRLEFNTSDNSNEYFRWTHTSAGTTYENMRLMPTSAGNSVLTINGSASAKTYASTVATGTAPLTVASTTVVPNLNADLLDGLHAASTNTASTVVARDVSGNFNAGTITAALSGNATTATRLQTPRNINGTAFDGSADIVTTEWVHSNRDFAYGTLITTSIDYSVTDGDPFVLEIKGNSYGALIPLDIQLQGYIYNNTIINYGAYSTGAAFPITAMNVGGKLCFWFARQAYWQGFNVIAYTAYGTRAINKVVSITDVVNPNGTKQVTITPEQILRSGNYTNYVGNGSLTVIAGTDIAGGGLLGTANQSGATSVTIHHADTARDNTTSSASPARNGTFTVVDSVTTNARGHVTAVNTKTITLPDFEIVSISKSLTLSTSWQDTGISSTDLTTGSYIIQVESVSDYTVGGQQYQEYYTGIMSWFSGGTNSGIADEISLHRAGHAPNSGALFLRVQRTAVGVLKLQISGTTSNTGPYTYNFKFRRMI